MPNRSKFDMPVIFESLEENWMIDVPNYQLFPQLITYLHFHEITEIGICLSGSGVCMIEDKEIPYKAGDVQIIFPYQKHYHRSGPDGSTWRWNNIITENLLPHIGVTDFSKLDEHLRGNVSAYGILDRMKYPKTCAAIRYFLEHDSLTQDSYKTADALVYERMALDYYNILLTLFEESRDCEKISLSTGISKMRGIAPALGKIKEAISDGTDISVTELAELCHCSTANFRKLFHAAFGCSPKEYLTACRIRRAKNQLSHTQDDILSIAMSVGYHDISGFNRAFLKMTGVTPSEYRKRHQRSKK